MSQLGDPTPSSRPVAGDQPLRSAMLRYVATYMRQNAGEHRGIPDTLTGAADAIDAAKEARNGCGAISGFDGPCCRGNLCATCARELESAISALLGGDDA